MTPGEIIASFNATVAAAKVLGELVKSVAGIEKRIEIENAVIELKQKILQHQGAQLEIEEKYLALLHDKHALSEELLDAKKKLAEAHDFKAETKRYRLVRVTQGLSVYALKKSAANGDAPHWLCPHCLAKGVKGYVQISGNALPPEHAAQTNMACTNCGNGGVVSRETLAMLWNYA